MDGFEKIDLTTEEKKLNDKISVKSPSYQDDLTEHKSGHMKRNILLSVSGIIVVLVIFIVAGIIIPAIQIISQAKVVIVAARSIATAAKLQNVQEASDNLTKTKVEMDKLQSMVQGISYLAYIPVANLYYGDANHMMNAAQFGLDGGKVLIDSVAPYADVLGLKGKGTFTGGTAEQRIRTAVQTFAKVAPSIDKISGNLISARKELDMIDTNHYPNFLGGGKIKKTITDIKKVADEADLVVTQASPLIKVLPALLGEPDEKKYLILFQNDKELRPTGGFITAYAVLRFDHGVPSPDSSDDIYTLDATIPNKQPAPRLIREYLPKVPQFNLRDSNLSPDFVVSMNTFSKMYASAGGYKKVNGIIGIDTYPLVDALNILGGSITVDGQTFTTKNDSRCNCANVIYLLEENADQPVGYVRVNRKGIVGDLMLAIMKKALSSSPKLYWGPLIQVFLADISQKHVLFDIYNKDAQTGLEALNAAGRIVAFDGDYLHINEANFGGAKSNMYTTENVVQNYDIASDGTVTKTLTINYKNPYPPSDCNLERGGLCLNALLRDVVRVYVPKGSQLVSSQGSEVKILTYDDLNKTVFEGYLTVRPLGVAKFILKYKLPFRLANGSYLPAMYQKQPGTGGFQYTILVNDHQIDQFALLQDKTIKIKQ